MPEMWQFAADSYREIRGESGAAVLGMLSVSEVPDDAESLKGRAERPSEGPRSKTNLSPLLTALIAMRQVISRSNKKTSKGVATW